MKLDAPQNADKKAQLDEFLSWLCGHLNQDSVRPVATWTPDAIRRYFTGSERFFYNKNTKRWVIPDRASWSNAIHPMRLMANYILPQMLEQSPQARIVMLNFYRDQTENNFIYKSNPTARARTTSQHIRFAAGDFAISPAKLWSPFATALDVAYRQRPFSEYTKMGLGIYPVGGTMFCHVDSRQAPASADYTWLGGGNRMEARRPGVLSWEEHDGLTTGRVARITRPESKVLAAAADVDPIITPPADKVIHDSGSLVSTPVLSVGLSDYATPEELAGKGIIAEFWSIEDWYLTQIGPTQAQEFPVVLESASKVVKVVTTAIEKKLNKVDNFSSKLRSDAADDPRRRYVQTIVDAEFWRRRYRGTSIPGVTMSFNPFPVPGFPALIMSPERPMIAQLTSISHNISVASATASSSCAFSAPRFWDEGDPWHWLGGWGESDHDEWKNPTNGPAEFKKFYRYVRRFPYWQNRYTMPTNTFLDPPTGVTRTRRDTPLDLFYLQLLGVRAIEYESSNRQAFSKGKGAIGYDYTKAQRVLRDRTGIADLEVNPNTLSVREYNSMIAGVDDKGLYKPGTLAHKFWGAAKPERPPESTSTRAVDDGYSERYGINERELMINFLSNRPKRFDNHLVYVGPTFGGLNVTPRQRSILAILKDLERREVAGGHPGRSNA